MKVILWKLIRDFRMAKGKLVLLILAAAFSGWGISSVAYGYFLTERDFEVNFSQTRPADMAIVVDNYTEGLVEKFLEDKHVVDVERREAINARIKSSQDNWMPVMLYAVEDVQSMRYDKFRIADPENRAPGKLLIEKNAWTYLYPDQQVVELLFQGNEEVVRQEVAGKVHDARQAPATMEGMVYAYATSIDLVAAHLEKGRRRLLMKTNVSSDKEQIEEVFERLKLIAERSGATIASVNIPTPGEHVHQGVVDGIAFLQESGGSILSGMGIVLLSLILLTWIYPQVNDIGVMKAIGASTRHLFTSYVIVLMGIILAGLAIGLPPGYKTAALYNMAVAFFQNFEVVTTLLPVRYHLIVLLIGIAIPVLFGILPLLKGARTTVNDAINKTFYIPHKGFFRLSQRLVSNPRYKYGLNNLFRHSQRTMLTVLLLAVGMALYFTASNVDHSIRADLSRFEKTSRYEVVTILPEMMTQERISFLDELPVVSRALPINSRRVSYIPPTSGYSEITTARALPREFIIEDQYVRRGAIDRGCSSCIYVCGDEMKNKFAGVALGEVIELTSTTDETTSWIFSGAIDDLAVIGSPFMIFNDSLVREFNLVAFELQPGLSATEVLDASNAIDDAFIDNGINLLRRMSVKRRLAGILGHLAPTFLIIKVTGIFTIVLGFAGLIIVLNLTIRERTREIGIMKSIGSPFRKISGMFNQEFLLISLAAIVAGGLMAVPLATGLIGVVAETIIRHPVPFKSDNTTILLAALSIVVVQTLLISVYNRFKIGKNARELLDHNF